MKKNNPDAYMQMASRYESGDGVFQSDTKALEMRIRAAELGNSQAYYFIGYFYDKGIVVEEDKSKAVEYLEISAKKGSALAHHQLAVNHHRSIGNIDESIKHLKVAASAGNKDAVDELMSMFKEKTLPKEDLTQTLRAYQASNDLIRSEDRDFARAIKEDTE